MLAILRVSLFSTLLICWKCVAGPAVADDTNQTAASDQLPLQIETASALVSTNNNDSRYFSDPVCGITCLHEALRVNGKNVSWSKLIDARYVSRHGSNAAQLVLAATDNGNKAYFKRHLSLIDLRNLDSPALLRVNNFGSDIGVGHWVLFLGCEGQNFRILDPPDAMSTLSPGELLSTWDNSAVIVQGGEPIIKWMSFLFLACICLMGLVLIQLAKIKSLPASSKIALVIFSPFIVQIAIEALGFGLFWSDPAIVLQVCRRNDDWRPSVIARPSQLVVSVSRSALFIDARMTDDFAMGHIPGAVSVPYYATLSERKRALSQVKLDHPVVVYCQSQKCPYADALAKALHNDGFTNITVYAGGFYEWKQFVKSRANIANTSRAAD